jgi:hypothetical protein
MKLHLVAAAVSAALLCFGPSAQAALVDFEATASGSQAEGFSATGSPGLTFFSATGSGLSVSDYGVQGDGQALGIFDDLNGNYLRGVFSSGVSSLSLEFGNDDPFFTNPGDLATLRTFFGAALIGEVTVLLNRNDAMDQAIGFSGPLFDSFTFAYTNAAGVPSTGGGGVNTGLTEIVDNISFSDVVSGVPEPATWAMMIMGFGAVGSLVRSRRRKAALAV